MEAVINFRAIERILAVIIGGLCIYLGYRLFFRIPEQKEGEATIKFPGDISIYIARVGPGVFFALFGAFIVAMSFYQGIEYFHETAKGNDGIVMSSADNSSSAKETEYFRGLNPDLSRGNFKTIQRQRLKLALEIEYLNSLPGLMKKDLSEQQRIEFKTRIANTKLSLMRSVWAEDWGDFTNFQLWVEAGASDPVPEGLEEAADYFGSG